MSITLADAIVRILPDDSALGPGFAKAQGQVEGWAGKLSAGVIGVTKTAVAGLFGLGAAGLAAGAGLVSLGSDAEEMQGKFNVVFANTGGQVTAQLDEFAGAVGRSKFELREMASAFGDTLKPMGFTEQAAADMSVGLTQLATDLGSFNNMPMDEALRRLQGTLIGSHENALAFGVIINENTLKAKLAEMGLDNLTGAALEQAKVQARMALLMEGTTDAQGDAERTAGSWANQMRGLIATLKDTGTEIGLKLLPVVTPLLKRFGEWAKDVLPSLVTALADKLIPTLQRVTDAIMLMTSGDVRGGLESLFGKETTDKIMHWLGVVGDVIDRVVTFVQEHGPALKAALLAVAVAFGVVAVAAAIGAVIAALTNPIVLVVAAIAALAFAWENDWLGIKTVVTGAVDVLKVVLNELWEVVEAVFKWITDAIQDGLEFWRTLFGAFGKLLSGDFQGFFNGLKDAWSQYFQWLSNFISNLAGIFSPKLGELARNMIDGLVNGIRRFGGNIKDALQGVIDAAILAIKRRLGIASPSRVMASLIGEPMAAGVGTGFQNQMRLETAGINGSLMGAVNAMGGMTYSPTVSIDARGSGMSENGLRRMVQDELKRSGREADMLRRSGR